MSPASRCRAVALAVCAALALTPTAAPATIDLLRPPPAPAVTIAPVAAAISSDPAGPARGTIVLVHAGGWAGHDAYAQQQLMERPGALFLQRGWRVVSIDYRAGTDGLQDVLDAAAAELARGTGSGPLCLYGESAGGHLALVAASRLRAAGCVIVIGAPTDLALYQAEASANADGRVKLVAGQSMRYFGTTATQLAPWDPVTLALAIRADILLIHERDDAIVSAQHARRMQAARPTAQVAELESGDPDDPSATFVHGTVSALGRSAYAAALGAFADRAVRYRAAERAAARTGCRQASRSVREIGVSRLRSVLRCLARVRPRSRSTPARGWRRTSLTLRGEINAARIWAGLQATPGGRHALRAAAVRRANVIVVSERRSRVMLAAV